MKSEELAAINERAHASPSLGYAFTHYRQDVEALLTWTHSQEVSIECLMEEVKAKELQLSEEQKKADGLLAHLGAIRAVLIIDGGDNMSPELRKALWLDHDVALDLQKVRREVVEAAKELKAKEKWPHLDIGGGRLARAIEALKKVEAARVEKGLPLETRIIEKRYCTCKCHGFLDAQGNKIMCACCEVGKKEKRVDVTQWDERGAVVEKRKPETIEDLLGECRECNRLVRDCGNHGPVQS